MSGGVEVNERRSTSLYPILFIHTWLWVLVILCQKINVLHWIYIANEKQHLSDQSMNNQQQIHPYSKMNGVERTSFQTNLFENIFRLISVHVSWVSDLQIYMYPEYLPCSAIVMMFQNIFPILAFIILPLVLNWWYMCFRCITD